MFSSRKLFTRLLLFAGYYSALPKLQQHHQSRSSCWWGTVSRFSPTLGRLRRVPQAYQGRRCKDDVNQND